MIKHFGVTSTLNKLFFKANTLLFKNQPTSSRVDQRLGGGGMLLEEVTEKILVKSNVSCMRRCVTLIVTTSSVILTALFIASMQNRRKWKCAEQKKDLDPQLQHLFVLRIKFERLRCSVRDLRENIILMTKQSTIVGESQASTTQWCNVTGRAHLLTSCSRLRFCDLTSVSSSLKFRDASWWREQASWCCLHCCFQSSSSHLPVNEQCSTVT